MNWFKLLLCSISIVILLVSGGASSSRSERELEFEVKRTQLNKSIVKLNKSKKTFAVTHDCGMAFLTKHMEDHPEEYIKLSSSCGLDASEDLSRDIRDMSWNYIGPIYKVLSNSEQESLFTSLKQTDSIAQSFPICVNALGDDSYPEYAVKMQKYFSDSIKNKKYSGKGGAGIGDISKVEIMEVSLFEDGNKADQNNNRIYSAEFQKDKTRYIWVELKVKNLNKEKKHNHKVVWKWFNSDGSLRGSMESVFVIQPQWNSSWIEKGWGSSSTGTWKKGTYKVELTIDNKIIERQFTIF